MSVVPFILNGSNRTIVQTRQEYEDADGLDGNVIFMQNLDTNQISNTESSNVSYDLRVGDVYRDHRDSGTTDLLNNQKIRLQPGAAVIIETVELVQFPKSRFGHIVPKVRLLQDGLSNTSSKVDPGYEGKLFITVFNLGKREISLVKGQKFCTLYVLDVAVKDEVTPYTKGPQRIIGNSRKDLVSQVLDFIELKQAYFTILLTLATIALTAVQIIQPFQNSQEQSSPSSNTINR